MESDFFKSWKNLHHNRILPPRFGGWWLCLGVEASDGLPFGESFFFCPSLYYRTFLFYKIDTEITSLYTFFPLILSLSLALLENKKIILQKFFWHCLTLLYNPLTFVYSLALWRQTPHSDVAGKSSFWSAYLQPLILISISYAPWLVS